MLNNLQTPLALVGRMLLALMFVLAGFDKITAFGGTAGYIASVGLPAPALLTLLAIVAEVGGGLAIIFGLYTRWAALALAGFTLLASFIFHAFWNLPADQQMMQQLMFMKNISVAGGLLVLAAFGAGAISLDAKRGK